jgi:hypothetical protein
VLDRFERLPGRDTLWTSLLRVTVAGDSVDARARPAVIGTYSIRENRVLFVPRFGFAEGVTYRVHLDASSAGVAIDSTTATRMSYQFTIPKIGRVSTARVVAVHPSADQLPENLLRWYIEFSEPMEPGRALEHVHLVDEAGAKVRGAFLELDEELWDASRRRITILFDPGRVKRGLKQNLEMGAPLVAGRRYRLVIDAAWPDARGAPLKSGYERQFFAGPADRMSPTPARWTMRMPKAGSRAPLLVTFDGVIDHVLGSRLQVLSSDGKAIRGVGSMIDNDGGWTFAPSEPWSGHEYEVRVPEALEDVAGNGLTRLFDVDQLAQPSRTGQSRTSRLVFRPIGATPQSAKVAAGSR